MNKTKMRFLVASAIVLSTCVISGAALAQTGAPPKKPGLLTRMKQKMTGKKGGATAHAGEIIGNKTSKVYHLPGSKGMLPAEKNRVYFKTEAEAKAAGYHAAGAKAAPVKKGPARDPKTGRFIKK